jgi:hypothetical protein
MKTARTRVTFLRCAALAVGGVDRHEDARAGCVEPRKLGGITPAVQNSRETRLVLIGIGECLPGIGLARLVVPVIQVRKSLAALISTAVNTGMTDAPFLFAAGAGDVADAVVMMRASLVFCSVVDQVLTSCIASASGHATKRGLRNSSGNASRC